MMKPRFIAFLALFVLASCRSLQPVALYEKVAEEDAFADFQFKEIFLDSQSSGVDGLKKQVCKHIDFPTEGSVVGNDHIHLQWDKTTECRYVGMGFDWGNYQGKDLTAIVDIAAIEFMIRMEQGSSTKLPLFFSMNDYGNKACRSKINYLDIEGGVIDTNWTRVRIPLQTFNYKSKGVNLANIKDFRIELQQSGDVHLDAMRLVRHEHRFPASSGPKAPEYVASLPMKIGLGKSHWWGINPVHSKAFRFAQNGLASAESNLHDSQEVVQVDFVKEEGNTWDNFGFAFHAWERVDLSRDYRTMALHFEVRSSTIPKLKVSLVSYTGPQRIIQTALKPHHVKVREDGFSDVYLPIKSFHNFEKVNWSAMQEVRFKVLQNAQFEMGNFELIEFRGNPEKPTQWKGI